MKTKEKIFWIITLFILSIFILYFLFIPDKVRIVSPKKGNIVEAVYALATVKAEHSYNLRPFVTEKISKIFVTEGDYVGINAHLLLLDTGIILRSPIAGVVSKVYMKDSEVLVSGQVVMTIINFDKMYLTTSLDQESALKVRKGQKAEISFESIRGEKITGTVVSIYPSGTDFVTKIQANKFPHGILPEMTADVAIEITRKDNVLMIPSSSLQSISEKSIQRQGRGSGPRNGSKKVIQKNKITVIRDGKKIEIKPKLGLQSGNWTEVDMKDVFQSDKILIKLPDESPVRILIIIFMFSGLIFIFRYFKKKKKEA